MNIGIDGKWLHIICSADKDEVVFLYILWFECDACLKSSGIRNNHLRCSVNRSVLWSFIKFTGEHLCQCPFFNKVAGCNFIKKETLAQVFSCEFYEISKRIFFNRTPLVAASVYILEYIFPWSPKVNLRLWI